MESLRRLTVQPVFAGILVTLLVGVTLWPSLKGTAFLAWVAVRNEVATARTLWVPAVNNHGGFGRWAFLEIEDLWDAENTIRTRLGLIGERK